MAKLSKSLDPSSSSDFLSPAWYYPGFSVPDATKMHDLLADKYKIEEVDDLNDNISPHNYIRELAQDLPKDNSLLLWFTVLFNPGPLEQFLDKKRLQEAQKRFDWKEFLAMPGGAEYFMDKGGPFIPNYVDDYPGFASAWRSLDPERRIQLYTRKIKDNLFGDNIFFNRVVIKFEGLQESFTVSTEDIKFLKYGRDVFIALSCVRNGTLPDDIQCLKKIIENEEVRRVFIRLVSSHKDLNHHNIFDKIFSGMTTTQIAIELHNVFNNMPRVSRKETTKEMITLVDEDSIQEVGGSLLQLELVEDAAKIAWDYFIKRLIKANPEEIVQTILALLIGVGEGGLWYFGSRRPIEMACAAGVIAELIITKKYEALFDRELCRIRIKRQRDPFAQRVLRTLDYCLCDNPRIECVYVYSLRAHLPLERDSCSDLWECESILPMTGAALKRVDGVKKLINFPSFQLLDPNERLEWKNLITRSVIEYYKYSIEYECENNDFIISKTSSYEPALKTPDEVVILASKNWPDFGDLFAKEDEEYFHNMMNEPIEESLVLALAITKGEERAFSFVDSYISQAKYPTCRLVCVAYLAYKVKMHGVNDEYVMTMLHKFGLLGVDGPDGIEKLVRNKKILIEALCEVWIKSWPVLPSNAAGVLFDRVKKILNSLESSAIIFEALINKLADSDEANKTRAVHLARALLEKCPGIYLSNPELVVRIKEMAIGYFSMFRKSLRKLNVNDSPPESIVGIPDAAWCIVKSGGEPAAIKQLLLTFRFIPGVALDRVLSPYCSLDKKHWSQIPQTIDIILNKNRDKESGRELRCLISHDLLSTLKPHKGSVRSGEYIRGCVSDGWRFDQSIKEPDSVWRYAYVKAVADLGADPNGTIHFHHEILNQVALKDPSPEVREAAGIASKAINTQSGWKSGSSKRLLLNAWWWIRQAHMISVGGTIDLEAALKRRELEYRT